MADAQEARCADVPLSYSGTAFSAPPPKRAESLSPRYEVKSGISPLAKALSQAVSAVADSSRQGQKAFEAGSESAATRPRRAMMQSSTSRESGGTEAKTDVEDTGEALLLAALLLLLFREGAEGGVLGALGTLFLLCL